MTLDREKLATELKRLYDEVVKVRRSLEDGEPDAVIAEQLQDVERAHAAVLEAGPSAGGVATTFSTFMRSMGGAMVDTQLQLDTLSERYVRGAAAKGYVLPSVFRVPRLKAEVKFAFEQISERTLNLIFYRTSHQSKAMHQQSVEFEIAAVPPPPEVLGALDTALAGIDWVIAPGQRERIFDAVKAAAIPGAVHEPDRERILAMPRSILVWALPAADTAAAAEQYFLLFAESGSDPNAVGLWKLDVAEPPRITVVFKFGRTPKLQTVDRGPFRDWVLWAADLQDRLLAELEG